MPLLSQWLDHAAEHASSQRALVYRDSYLSWRGLQHRVDRRAQELRAMGLTPGTLVGLLLGNVPDFVVLTLALDRIGAVTVPIDPATGSRDLDMILDSAPIRALITRPAASNPTPAQATKARVRGKATPMVLRVADATSASAPKHQPHVKKRLAGSLLTVNFFKQPALPLEMSSPSMVAFTSDAGGDPKGVLRDDVQLQSIATAMGTALHAQAGQIILLPTPFHYSSGFDAGLLLGLQRRLTMVLEDEFSAKGLLRLFKEDAADFVLGTPAQFSSLCQAVSGAQPPPKAVCLCVQSPGLKAAAAAFKEKFRSILVPLFHSAETGPVAINHSGVLDDETLVGRPLEGIAIRVTSADGTALPPGFTGEIWLQTASASAAAVPQLPPAIRNVGPLGVTIGRKDGQGWFRTGDVGFVNAANGNLHVSGRQDDLVWVEGRRLALGEVEGCLEAFAFVKHAQVRIVYDEHKGPMVVARVVPISAFRTEDIIEHCARYLAPYKVPRQIEICREL